MINFTIFHSIKKTDKKNVPLLPLLSFLGDRAGINWDKTWTKNKQKDTLIEKNKDIYDKKEVDKNQQIIFKTEN